MHDLSAKWLSTIHTALYRTTGGKIGRHLVKNDMLLLTTIGRRSGHHHTVPLLYLQDGSRLVVIASWGGRDNPPHWYLNLVADPKVNCQVEGESFEAIAVKADDSERRLWWPRIVEAYHGYVDYQSRTDRQIPVIFLDRQRPAGSDHA
jgi:deazaflavin-dependent oxidoreductase (nitroreductase family)